MIKGQVFANQLFENQIFALFINTFTDGKDGVSDNYKNGMAITYSGSDVTIDSGAVLIQGRFLEEDTSTTISAGADNMYCKLVIEIDLDKTNTTTEFNQGYYKIVKSSTTWPTLTQTNIVKNVSGIYQYELARFRTTANGITDFEDRRTFIDFDSIYDEIREHIQDIDDESIFVLKSGSTMTGKLIAEGGVEGNVEGNLTGNVTGNCSGTASKLATARTIALSGAVTGSTTFDGSANKTITTSLTSNTKTYTLTGMDDYTTWTIKLLQQGNTVQVDVKVSIPANKTNGMLYDELSNMPSWAKPNRTPTSGSNVPLIVAPIVASNGTTIGVFQMYKTTNPALEYAVACILDNIPAHTSAISCATTGTYILL